MLRALDDWARLHPEVCVIAQVGADEGDYPHLETVGHVSQAEYDSYVGAAALIVSHAGMGTILTAAEVGKPVVVVPRLAAFGEHRNDHQVDTAAEMAALSVVHVVEDAARLGETIDGIVAAGAASAEAVQPVASRELIAALQDFIWAGPPVRAPQRVPMPARGVMP
jgi:UDP-N-acetylglucosamine transferase subunit ALG13